MAVDALGVVAAELERGQRGHRAGHADRIVRVERRQLGTNRLRGGVELVARRRVGAQMPLGQSDRADVEARSLVSGDQLGRAAADVEHERPVAERAAVRHAAAGELGLLRAAEQARREAVAPLDLAEEGLAVLGVADGARPDRQHALGAESLELAAEVGEDVADTGDRQRQQLAPLVHAFAEPSDHGPPRDLVHALALDVRDQQAGRVRAEVDDAHAHPTKASGAL